MIALKALAVVIAVFVISAVATRQDANDTAALKAAIAKGGETVQQAGDEAAELIRQIKETAQKRR